MKIKAIAILVLLMALLVPATQVGAAQYANVTVNATPAYISVSVSPTNYGFGVVSINTNYTTTNGYFTITNGSTVQTDQTISVETSSWSGGVGWTHSDTGTAGADTAAMYASKNTGTLDIIVKNAAPNNIYENCPASTGYSFELRLCSPTSFSDGILKVIVVRITAAAG